MKVKFWWFLDFEHKYLGKGKQMLMPMFYCLLHLIVKQSFKSQVNHMPIEENAHLCSISIEFQFFFLFQQWLLVSISLIWMTLKIIKKENESFVLTTWSTISHWRVLSVTKRKFWLLLPPKKKKKKKNKILTKYQKMGPIHTSGLLSKMCKICKNNFCLKSF